ncbi:MAG: hypothetical protein FRX48_01790 [Lasallia pustulata]|uniref:Bromo domain-containing protein n=1 Tax=Lasallia pustulata TaxID=136370 RepID=A0A5M8PZ01_9LECA|nr:MAG: hypothetical protein FRX48_01790 [Lasallia pustulata]
MATAALHTPLETLLLFQSIHSVGVDSSAFTRIAEALKANEFIRESGTFNADRLSPDALKGLYLASIKDEVRSEAAKSPSSAGIIDGQYNPRKRKLSTPPFDTSEAAQHEHLLPHLVNRLYARYKENAVKAIEDDERRYRLLTRDIQEIERGEWDARLQHEEVVSKKDSKNAASIQTLLRHDSGNVPALRHGHRQTDSPQLQNASPSTAPPCRPLPPQDGNPLDISTNTETNAYPSHLPPTAIGQQSQITPHDVSQDISRPSSQPRNRENGVPFLPLPQLPNQGFNMDSPLADGHRRLPQPAPQSQSAFGPSPSPRPNQVPLAQPERSSASPIILPPPVGMLRSSGSSSGPLDALADMAGQQYRTNPPLPSPRQPQHPSIQQHPVQLPQPRNYMRNAYPYYDSQSPYASSYQQYGQPSLPQYYSPTHSGISPLPTPVSVHGQGPRSGHPPQYQSPLPPYGHFHSYNSNPYPQTPQPAAFNPTPVSRFVEQRTPIQTSSARRRLPQPSPINTSVSSTKWKNADHPAHMRPPGSPVSPASGDVSPVSEKAPSPVPEPSEIAERASPSQESEQKPTKEVPKSGPDDRISATTPSRTARGGRSRGAASRGRGGRAGSTTSSVIAGSTASRTRSQSLVSHADEHSMDANRASSRQIKPETPASVPGDDNLEIAANTPDERSRKSNRPRRGTSRGLEVPEHKRTSSKRRRSVPQDTPDGTSETPDVRLPNSPSITFSRPNHVLISRNFPRTSATIMNDITGHKLASLFAKPLTEREAPGYKNLIYRPQDLKSIKSAISAGSRAVAAASEASGTPAIEAGSPMEGVNTPSKSTGSSLWVSMNADIVPPKGIVNSAQLEKELMRMFANAVMFNPDSKRGFGPAFKNRQEGNGEDDGPQGLELGGEEEGGVVADTREMFEAVEKSVTNWRAAERAVESTGSKGNVNKIRASGERDEDEADELEGEEDADEEKGVDEGASVLGKRRRK